LFVYSEEKERETSFPEGYELQFHITKY